MGRPIKERREPAEKGTDQSARKMPQDVAAAAATPGLVVYHAREGEEGDLWTKQFGVIRVPDGWVFLPRGDAFVTRRVKTGPHWILEGRYNRRGGYRPVLGVFAPSGAIDAARAAAEATKAKREQARPKAARQREKAEARYRREFEAACLEFMKFAPAHHELARKIAAGTTDLACQKYSGRVGRTGLLSLEAKAALAVRAYIRHNHTDYESNLPAGESWLAHEEYREAKAIAHAEVNRFLEDHRAAT